MYTTYRYPAHLPPTTPPPSTLFACATRPVVYADADIHDHDDTYRPYSSGLPVYSEYLLPSPGEAEGSKAKIRRTVAEPRMRGLTPDDAMTGGGTKGKMDMNMAPTGSLAAQPGFSTPLAAYAAQMVAWLWYGNLAPSPAISHSHHPLAPTSPSPSTPSPLLSSPDPFEPLSPINPLQVAPTAHFAQFVSHILKLTAVSHSVTLVALLYIYRLKSKNKILALPGSEHRPFVASLILGNKYLDDNTYTNATWADLTSIPLADVNKMESEFIRGLDYNLGVQLDEYNHWRNLLDGFILARQREAAQMSTYLRGRPAYSPPSMIHTPTQTFTSPYADSVAQYRARSASPKTYSPSVNSHRPPVYGYAMPSPREPELEPRKRSAEDAFTDTTYGIPTQSALYEQLRQPSIRRSAYPLNPLQVVVPPFERPASGSTSTLGRSSSLSRQIARLPGESGRRGSMGHVYANSHGEEDLRHLAVMNDHEMGHGQGSMAQAYGWTADDWEGYSSLVAPYERPSGAQMPHPDHLMFYELAAEAHPGPDGAPRKGVLRYQDPSTGQSTYQLPQSYPTHNRTFAFPPPPAASQVYAHDGISAHQSYVFPPPPANNNMLPSAQLASYPSHAHSHAYADAQAGLFANNGPPGYAYDPTQQWQMDRMASRGDSRRIGLGIGQVQGLEGMTSTAELLPSPAHRMTTGSDDANDARNGGTGWRTRSEWNSPMGWQG